VSPNNSRGRAGVNQNVRGHYFELSYYKEKIPFAILTAIKKEACFLEN